MDWNSEQMKRHDQAFQEIGKAEAIIESLLKHNSRTDRKLAQEWLDTVDDRLFPNKKKETK